jgi:putative membrane protein
LNAVVHASALVLAQPGFGSDGEPWDNGWWVVWRIGMLLFWIVVIGLAFWWFRRSGWRRQPTGTERARDILAERFARGEITADEYHERLEQIR